MFPVLIVWDWRDTQCWEAERRGRERLERERDPQWREEHQARRAHEARLVEVELSQMRRATRMRCLLARGHLWTERIYL
jgi:hypothetical protein